MTSNSANEFYNVPTHNIFCYASAIIVRQKMSIISPMTPAICAKTFYRNVNASLLVALSIKMPRSLILISSFVAIGHTNKGFSNEKILSVGFSLRNAT